MRALVLFTAITSSISCGKVKEDKSSTPAQEVRPITGRDFGSCDFVVDDQIRVCSDTNINRDQCTAKGGTMVAMGFCNIQTSYRCDIPDITGQILFMQQLEGKDAFKAYCKKSGGKFYVPHLTEEP